MLLSYAPKFIQKRKGREEEGLDSAPASDQPAQVAPIRRDRAVRAGAEHRINAGARLHLGTQGQRLYSVTCSCGWTSESCSTAVLAEADGEQHLTLAQVRRARRTDLL